MKLAAHRHRCHNLPKKRMNTLLLYKEGDDPVKDGLANVKDGTLDKPRFAAIHSRQKRNHPQCASSVWQNGEQRYTEK